VVGGRCLSLPPSPPPPPSRDDPDDARDRGQLARQPTSTASTVRQSGESLSEKLDGAGRPLANVISRTIGSPFSERAAERRSGTS
jgi:hypothetical protein